MMTPAVAALLLQIEAALRPLADAEQAVAQPNKQSNSFPASTGQDSCRREVRIVDIDHHG
jgi:hypothetical protein